MIVDHRGYGLSEGRPSAATFESDAVVAFDYLAGQGDRNIVVHGQSLGSFAAGHVAANRPAAGVVLESSVTTTEDWAKVLMPSLARPFVRVEIAESLRGRGNLANVRLIEEPLLLLVGAKDETTPPHLSRSLYEASPLPPQRKRLAVIARAGHDNVLEQAEAAAAYREFLASILSADRRR
jgi:pimeloyl-ACP methyl ester carboxylesterase